MERKVSGEAGHQTHKCNYAVSPDLMFQQSYIPSSSLLPQVCACLGTVLVFLEESEELAADLEDLNLILISTLNL